MNEGPEHEVMSGQRHLYSCLLRLLYTGVPLHAGLHNPKKAEHPDEPALPSSMARRKTTKGASVLNSACVPEVSNWSREHGSACEWVMLPPSASLL